MYAQRMYSAYQLAVILCLTVGGCESADEHGGSEGMQRADRASRLHVFAGGCELEDGEFSPSSSCVDGGGAGHLARVDDLIVAADERSRFYRVTNVEGVRLTTTPATLGEISGALDEQQEDGEALFDDSFDQTMALEPTQRSFANDDNPKIKLDVGMDLDPRLDFDFGFEGRGLFGSPALSSFALVVSGHLDSHARLAIGDVDGGQDGVRFQHDEKLLEKDKEHTTWVGPIPFTTSTKFTVWSSYDMAVFGKPEVTAGYEIDADVGFGPKYEGGQWSLVDNLEPEGVKPEGRIDGRVEGQIALKLEFDVELWRTFRVGFVLEPYVDIEIGARPRGSDVYAESVVPGLTVHVRCNLEALDCGRGAGMELST